MADNLDRILGRLEKVRGRKGSWTASCPAHRDKSPSLAIRQIEDGRILMHCFAGCSVDEVVGAIGFDLSDLFPDDDKRQKIGNTGPMKPAFYATDLLRIIEMETLIVSVAAHDMSEGKVLSESDANRLRLARDRIYEAASYA